jgi:Family of unknown function (DUF6932)
VVVQCGTESEGEQEMVLPRLTADGLLPPGDHLLTLPELRQSYLVTGEGLNVPRWDSTWRAQLVDNMEMFIRQLWDVGVERIFVNGSLVTSKPGPGDIDAYFECTFGAYPLTLVSLMQLEPPLHWDLTHRPIHPRTGAAKPMMWHRYRVELLPRFVDYPTPTGVFDENGNEIQLVELFRRDRATSRPKGMVQLV